MRFIYNKKDLKQYCKHIIFAIKNSPGLNEPDTWNATTKEIISTIEYLYPDDRQTMRVLSFLEAHSVIFRGKVSTNHNQIVEEGWHIDLIGRFNYLPGTVRQGKAKNISLDELTTWSHFDYDNRLEQSLKKYSPLLTFIGGALLTPIVKFFITGKS